MASVEANSTVVGKAAKAATAKPHSSEGSEGSEKLKRAHEGGP